VEGKHYQACCMNKECSIHGICASSIPHPIDEEVCYISCVGKGNTVGESASSAATCSLILVENGKITVIKQLGE